MKTYKVPLVIRGEVIEDYTREYAGRQGGINFQTPDVNKYMKQLVTGPAALSDLYQITMDEIVDFIVEVGKRIDLATNTHLQEAYEISTLTSGMTPSVLKAVYSGFDGVFTHANINEYIDVQLGRDSLEGWVERELQDGRKYSVRAFGARMVHVMAGNSPMVAFLTILRTAVTRSDSIMKLPSNDPLSGIAFLRTMIDIDRHHPVTRHLSAAYWKGGDETTEARVYTPRNVEKIVAWGGFDSVKHITRYLQPGIDLITLDPKHSASIIGADALADEATVKEVARRAASDVGSFNQELCANARVIYAHCDPDNPQQMDQLNLLGSELYQALQTLPRSLSTESKYVVPQLQDEIDGLEYQDQWYRVFRGDERSGAVIVSQIDEPVEFTALLACRTANIVPVKDLEDILKRITADTQTVGVYPNSFKDEIKDRLGFQGAQHIISLGYVPRLNFIGPQDAIETERRMVKWVKDVTLDPDTVAGPWEAES
jgi:Acyl-CoA reductase (LuxC)